MITVQEAQEMYDEMLNEIGQVSIGNLQYDPAYTLKQVDPIAYNVGLTDYIDNLIRDGIEVEGY